MKTSRWWRWRSTQETRDAKPVEGCFAHVLGNRPISVYSFPRRALTLCPQLCMGIQPGARFPARSADALTGTLYGHSTQAIYRNRPIGRPYQVVLFHVDAQVHLAAAARHELVLDHTQVQRRKLKLKAKFESGSSTRLFQAPNSRHFQRGFHRVNLHRLTQVAGHEGEQVGGLDEGVLPHGEVAAALQLAGPHPVPVRQQHRVPRRDAGSSTTSAGTGIRARRAFCATLNPKP